MQGRTRSARRFSRRAWVGASFVIAALTCFGALGEAAAAASPRSDVAVARLINVTSADLPDPATWAGSVQTPNTAAQIAQAHRALRCISNRSGKISPDPFGTIGRAGGTVTADVQSSMFAKKRTASGLPGVSSEVDFLTSSTQATKDLAAFDSKVDLSCLTALIANVTAGEVGHKVLVNASVTSIPHYGSGNGGVGIRFTVTGLSAPLVDVAYFYVEGRAEVSLSFVNLGTSFPTGWAHGIAARVMARAKTHV